MSYTLSKWRDQIFRYPRSAITTVVSYDEYWKARKRGGVVQISDWQQARTDIALLEMRKAHGPVTILDIGCGDGAVLKYLKEKLPGMHGVGVDVSEPMLASVKAMGFDARTQNIANPDERIFPPSDYALLFEIIEHVPDPELLLAAAYEASHRGVFISIPNTGYITYRLRLLFGKFPVQWVEHPGEHVRFWTMTDMRWWLSALGYTSATINSYKGIPVLNRLWPNLFAEGIVIFIQK